MPGGAEPTASVPAASPCPAALNPTATTAYSDARQRLPLDWIGGNALARLAVVLLTLGGWRNQDLPVELLDGSTKRLRPHGDIAQQFPAHRTRRKQAYWCVARVLVSFCAATGVATAARLASILCERTSAGRAIDAGGGQTGALHRRSQLRRLAGRRAAVQGGGHALVRLTKVRARRLWGRKRLPAFLDLAVVWSASPHDQIDPGLGKDSVEGRLIVIQAHPRGHRPQTLYLFTTLTDVQAYPPKRLLELYGWRWQVELNFRTVKSSMHMDQSEAKSADMVCKEFYAGNHGL